MNQQAYYRVSIKGIVINDEGRILLAKKESGLWEMLGGGLNHNEAPMTCLKREVHEETGLEITYVSPSPLYFITAARRNKDSYIANVIYQIKLNSFNFIPSDECQELRFFNTEEMRQVDLYPNMVQLLEILEKE